MSDEDDRTGGPDTGGDQAGGGRRRRRRRRRRRGGTEEGPALGRATTEWGDDVLVTEHTGGDDGGPVRRRRTRRTPVDFGGPIVNVPSSGKNPARKRSSRARRGAPGSAAARRRRMSRAEVDTLAAWLDRMPETLVSNLYRGLGGQPHRVAGRD